MNMELNPKADYKFTRRYLRLICTKPLKSLKIWQIKIEFLV